LVVAVGGETLADELLKTLVINEGTHCLRRGSVIGEEPQNGPKPGPLPTQLAVIQSAASGLLKVGNSLTLLPSIIVKLLIVNYSGQTSLEGLRKRQQM